MRKARRTTRGARDRIRLTASAPGPRAAAKAAGTAPTAPERDRRPHRRPDRHRALHARARCRKTSSAIADHGTTFTSSIVSAPLCCPSRAGFLTGQYPHNSGVFDNEPGYAALIDKTSTIYSWLQAAGYRTGHVGRYLLNYDREPTPGGRLRQTDCGFAAPPGHRRLVRLRRRADRLHGRHLLRQRHPGRRPGPAKRGYSTRMINHAALDFIRGAKADPRPFFLMVAHLAPHSSHDPGPGPCGRRPAHPEDAASSASRSTNRCPSRPRSTRANDRRQARLGRHPPARSATPAATA